MHEERAGAGKSTLASALGNELRARGHLVEILDGDAVRQYLSKGLSFSKDDRDSNVAVHTDREDVETSLKHILSVLERHGLINSCANRT